ncbi:MAG: formate dehydrogenase subunit delta [Actinomycetes bacterium]
MTVESLVKMANQIAVSVPDQGAAVEQTVTHLKSFWAPAMIDALARHRADHPDAVSPTVATALDILRPEYAHG